MYSVYDESKERNFKNILQILRDNFIFYLQVHHALGVTTTTTNPEPSEFPPSEVWTRKGRMYTVVTPIFSKTISRISGTWYNFPDQLMIVLTYKPILEILMQGLTETFRAKEECGKATFVYEEFLLNVLPFIIA